MVEPAPRPATVSDVADAAGVSRQTVSNVVNRPERVAAPTRERVEQAIRELDYRPSRAAQNLQSRRTGLIAYAVRPRPSRLINHVMEEFVQELSRAAATIGHHVVLASPPPHTDETDHLAGMVHERVVDACVIADVTRGDPRIARLRERRVPFVAFGRADVDVAHRRVDVDNAAGVRQAVAHLHADGHECIAMVGWEPDGGVGDVRVEGWRDALLGLGIAADDALLFRGPNGPHTGARALRHWHDAGPAPTAVVCVSDSTAIGVLRAAEALDVRVGRFRDLAVVGFDDTPVAPLLAPPLTSVRQPIAPVAHGLVDQLEGLLRGDDPDEDHEVLVTPHLMTRESA